MWWILKKKRIYVFVLYLFSSHLPFMLPWTLNLNGVIYTQEKQILAYWFRKGRKSVWGRKWSCLLCFSNNWRHKAEKHQNTLCFKCVTERTLVSENVSVYKHFSLCVAYFPHVANHPTGSLSVALVSLSLVSSCQDPLSRPGTGAMAPPSTSHLQAHPLFSLTLGI